MQRNKWGMFDLMGEIDVDGWNKSMGNVDGCEELVLLGHGCNVDGWKGLWEES